MYVQLLVFQLYTHAHIFDNGGGDSEKEEQELATMSLAVSCLGLLLVTLSVCFFSHYLVNSIEGFTEASGVSRTFVGLIILPIVGNAVEHISAVVVAMKDKMDLAMGIAVGSCTQISLFVVPLTVLCGWIFDREMTLNFPHFEVVLYVLSVFTVSVVCSNPKCNWLEGSLLITTYSLIAVGFWFEKVKTLKT
jgi:Ca2+:H+ antiporter